MTRIGIGTSTVEDAFASGRMCAETAMQTGGIARADIVIAFCAGDLDHDKFFRGLRAAVGPDTPIIGGSAIGVITNDFLSYRGFPAAAALIKSETIRFAVAAAGGLDQDEFSAGERLAAALPRSEFDKLLLIFYDSIRIPAAISSPPILNSSAPLLAGIERRLQGMIPITGAGLLGGYGFGATRQFCGDRVAGQHAVGCIVSGAFSIYHSIMHGCVPLDGVYHRITRMEGSVLHELDHKPIIPMINELFGNTDWQKEHPVSYLTVGVNYGDRYGEPVEGSYVNRLITGVTPDGQGIGMFEPDLSEGTELQFMIRDNKTMFTSVRQNTADLLARVHRDGNAPIGALYIDCAGRTAEQSLTDHEEASEVQSILNSEGIPLLGFYSGVEIAPLLNRSRGLDWTAVLLLLAENR